MLSFLFLLLGCSVIYNIGSWCASFYYNLQKAKQSGIYHIPVPVYSLHRFWLITHRLYLPLLRKLPDKYTQWVDYVLPDFVQDYGHEIFERVGHDTFLTVAPGGICMHTCEPAVVTQITTRRNDFPKPTRIYASVNVYGDNVLSAEGHAWRRHRKATSPPFTEKNNHVVWTESIDQASKMLQSWLGEDGKGECTVERVMDDTMQLSLHVISRAGFGRKVEWPKSNEEGRSKKAKNGYLNISKIQNDKEGLGEGHSMTYTYALHCLLENILLYILLPKWLLGRSPFKPAKKADEAYREWGNYMKEMVQMKQQDLKEGIDSDQMDIISQLVKGQMAEKGIEKSDPLTDEEILGNMFVLILAGHETAANSIHFIMLYLALYPKSQRLLQKDLDRIFQGRPPREWSYHRDLPALFGGMAGAVLNEELRLMPPVIGIPKSTWGVSDQPLIVEGRQCTVPKGTYISLATPGAHRNAKHWPTGPPTYPGGKTAHPRANLGNDLEEFRPERWLLDKQDDAKLESTRLEANNDMPSETVEGGDLRVNEAADTSERLYTPDKGVYFPFSDGYRSCLGRRFAQVEVLAAVAVIFQNYSAELAVDNYASDEEVIAMNLDDRAEVWQKAAEDARELLLTGLGVIFTLQMRDGHVKLRLTPRGQEKFPAEVDDIWKKNHPDLCSFTGLATWRSWTGLKVHHQKGSN